MDRFIEGVDRGQVTLFPDRLEDWIDDDNPVRVVDAFVDALDLHALGFERTEAAATGRPGYHPAVLLKLYIYGYLNRVQSSRRLEREAGRNVEVMWLVGRLVPDHKTIADFRKDNGPSIRKVYSQFVELCRRIGLLSVAGVAIDGSKFKAVNNRDRNFTKAKMARRMKQIEDSVSRYLHQLDSADHQEPTAAITSRVERLHDKIGNPGHAGIARTTFYGWYDRYQSGGPEALEDRTSRPSRVWNRIPDEIRDRIVRLALDRPELSPRELAVLFTDTQKYFVSERSVHRFLKERDLITSPAFIVIKAVDSFKDKTTRPNELWQSAA